MIKVISKREQALKFAREVALELGDPLSLSWAFRELGLWHEKLGNYSQALNLTQEALRVADQFPEEQWKNYWQIGRIYLLQGWLNNFYDQALDNLEKVRKKVAGNRVLQLKLYKDSKPLYEDFFRVLLQTEEQQNIDKAIKIFGFYQLVKIETYFGFYCNYDFFFQKMKLFYLVIQLKFI